MLKNTCAEHPILKDRPDRKFAKEETEIISYFKTDFNANRTNCNWRETAKVKVEALKTP